MPQIQDNPFLPVIMPPLGEVPSIRDIGKKPENKKDEDTRPKKPGCPHCGGYHWPYAP